MSNLFWNVFSKIVAILPPPQSVHTPDNQTGTSAASGHGHTIDRLCIVAQYIVFEMFFGDKVLDSDIFEY